MVRSAGVVLCGSDWRQTARLPCGEIQELAGALDAADCERSERVLTALKDRVRLQPHTVKDEERRLLTTAQLARWQMCSGKP